MHITSLSHDSVIALTHELCSIPSHVDLNTQPPQTEEALARHIEGLLRQNPWLHTTLQEIQPGRFNVLAADCAPEEIQLLIIGHLDTVPMSTGWTKEPGTIQEGRYYNLGAGDTKGGIAAALDAIPKAGPTKGVGYLFYCDEEYHFLGMTDFLQRYPEIKPPSALSVCGTPESMMIGCRGLIELEITLRGVSGHASRQSLGCNAVQTLQLLIQDLEAYCSIFSEETGSTPTSFNLAAFTGGSSLSQVPKTDNGPPEVITPANKIPDLAWGLIDIRPGSPKITALGLRRQIELWLESFNVNRSEETRARIERLHFTHEFNAYASSLYDMTEIVRSFEPVHKNRSSKAENYGYMDAAELAAQRGTALACIAPTKGKDHAPDEYVDLNSLITYRDACVNLLGYFKR